MRRSGTTDIAFGVIWFTVAACVFGLFVWAILDEIFAETFSLRKDSWGCTASHLETTHIPVTVNNITTYSPHVTEVCDQWSRNP